MRTRNVNGVYSTAIHDQKSKYVTQNINPLKTVIRFSHA